MRTVVTGARGRLGGEVADALERRGHVVLRHRGHEQFDLADAERALAFVREVKPTAIVHCAARTDSEACERDPAGAERDNVTTTAGLLDAAVRTGAYFLYVSTAFVFDGVKRQPYHEDDAPNPVSVYAKTKRAGEEAVLASEGRWAVVRSDWLYGVRGSSFPKMMLTQANAGEACRLVADETGSPTYITDLAEAMSDLVEERERGIFHLTNAGSCSPAQWAETLFDLAGLNIAVERLTHQQLASELARAPRPFYHALTSRRWAQTGHTPMRPWQAALTDFLDRSLGGASRAAGPAVRTRV